MAHLDGSKEPRRAEFDGLKVGDLISWGPHCRALEGALGCEVEVFSQRSPFWYRLCARATDAQPQRPSCPSGARRSGCLGCRRISPTPKPAKTSTLRIRPPITSKRTRRRVKKPSRRSPKM